ncbi:division/cell wall cluster transcriptional repressor MraZ [bacterium]|nr:MAG: division/cell wall cluster transcriptional repressor MraZ [bacterium]
MLIGTQDSILGDKNRIAMPKKFSDELGNKLILTRGYDNCLIVVNDKNWNKLISQFEAVPFLNSDVRDVRRFLIGSAIEVELDSQRRFVLSENLKTYANLTKEVYFVGLGDWVEVWDKTIWSKRMNEMNSTEIANKVFEVIKS